MHERVGEIRKNTFGTEMRIIAYRSSSDIDVEMLDSHHYVKRNTTYSNFKKGNILNPFDPNTYKHGYTGDGCYISMDNGKSDMVYTVWANMLERCYSQENSNKHKSYYNISEVCNEWLNFQNFAQWFNENKYECDGRLHLDKDILYPGNKIYSPYHCILVPQTINEQFKNNTRKKNDIDLPYTIYRKGSGYTVTYMGNKLGDYETLQEAIKSYEEARYERVLCLIDNYPNMPNNVKEAIINIKYNWAA